MHERHRIVLTRRFVLLGFAALSMPVSTSRDAAAHSRVLDATPSDGAVVARPPDRVLVRFTSAIDRRSMKISLIGPTDSSSLVIEGSGGPPITELAIPVPDQGAGSYLVRWDIVSADGERIRGRLRFLVRR
ncbi:MAG: hypothetical protein BGO98_10950 [Myxococcales bacterium 68-20]|nr:MAG: hypothetical protein BGO98_10950 [Myxococcales bacterium 68-20]